MRFSTPVSLESADLLVGQSQERRVRLCRKTGPWYPEPLDEILDLAPSSCGVLHDLGVGDVVQRVGRLHDLVVLYRLPVLAHQHVELAVVETDCRRRGVTFGEDHLPVQACLEMKIDSADFLRSGSPETAPNASRTMLSSVTRSPVGVLISEPL